MPQARVSVIESKKTKKSVRPEIELTFWDKSNRKTHLIVGGFDVNKIKKLSVANANDGMQMPMGIANHTFNQSYKDLMVFFFILMKQMREISYRKKKAL